MEVELVVEAENNWIRRCGRDSWVDHRNGGASRCSCRHPGKSIRKSDRKLYHSHRVRERIKLNRTEPKWNEPKWL